jgi:hypothetical protein
MHHQFPNKGIGYGIFYLILICLPFLSWLFGILNWILDNIRWILIAIAVIIITSILVWFALDDEKEVQEEEENV